jgi:uncharacterized protein
MVLAPLLQSIWLFALLQGRQQIPAPVGVVNDFAHVIPAEQARLIEQIAQDVRQKSRGEITVVTLSDIGQEDVANVALRIGREWKVGKIGNPGDPTRNAGTVILIVPKETNSDGRGRCRIETGQGAEGFITDAQAGDICRSVTPLFQQRDYGGAITQLTYAVAQRFAGEFHFTVDSTLRPPERVQSQPTGGRGGRFPPQLIFIAIVLIILLFNGRRGGGGGCLPLVIPFVGGGGRGGWSGGGGGFGGGGGGGFGGFGGGGGFSGGGGGSNW